MTKSITVTETRSSAMVEGPRNVLVSIEKSLQSMNDLDIYPRLSQLLLLNGRTTYHFLFVNFPKI